MLISQLINTIGLELPKSTNDFEVKGLSLDSRNVKEGYIFFSIKGSKTDGRIYLNQALENGAVFVVADKAFINDYKGLDNIIFVDNIRKIMAKASCIFYDNPSNKIKVVGITGTNGKTTISYIIKSILETAGHQCGLIGTINYVTGKEVVKSARLTTPDSIELNSMLAEMVKNGIEYCAMEVSSIALENFRVHNIDFDSALFTNLTSEHMDLHGNMQNYFKAKKLLFDNLGEGNIAISNSDDLYGIKILSNCKGTKKYYSINEESDLKAEKIKINLNGLKFYIKYKNKDYFVESTLTGRFNVYNILAGIQFGIEKNIPIQTILSAIKSFKAIKGRFNRTSLPNGAHAIVDYSHTSDSLKNAIESAIEVRNAESHNGRVITIFGCGGDRDKTKRPVMGKIATELSDIVIITSDNPRTEDPNIIVKDILEGIEGNNNYKVIVNREEAIKEGIKISREGDIILVCGKGHETYQEINGIKTHFDDEEIIIQNSSIFEN